MPYRSFVHVHCPQGLSIPTRSMQVWIMELELLTEVVDAACANLARCKPGIVSPNEGLELELYSIFACPNLLRLVAFFPRVAHLQLSTPDLGAVEFACLGEAGAAACGVTSLGLPCRVLPSFWSPELWRLLPGLRDVRVTWTVSSPAPIDAIVQCLAAAPHGVTVHGLCLEDPREYAELHARLALLPEHCGVELVS